MSGELGIYPDPAALDHDVAMLLEELLTTLQAREVASAPALAAIRRNARGMYRG